MRCECVCTKCNEKSEKKKWLKKLYLTSESGISMNHHTQHFATIFSSVITQLTAFIVVILIVQMNRENTQTITHYHTLPQSYKLVWSTCLARVLPRAIGFAASRCDGLCNSDTCTRLLSNVRSTDCAMWEGTSSNPYTLSLYFFKLTKRIDISKSEKLSRWEEPVKRHKRESLEAITHFNDGKLKKIDQRIETATMSHRQNHITHIELGTVAKETIYTKLLSLQCDI